MPSPLPQVHEKNTIGCRNGALLMRPGFTLKNPVLHVSHLTHSLRSLASASQQGYDYRVSMPGGGPSRISQQDGHNQTPVGDRFELGSFSIDEYRPIKVVVIGAGFSGILAGIRSVHVLLHQSFCVAVLIRRF